MGGDTKAIDVGFERLSPDSQAWGLKMLGNPHLTPHYFRQMPSNIREELDSFRASLPERDRAALNRRLLLS